MQNPILYTTGCPRCKVLAAKLEKANIEYEKCEDMESILKVCNDLGVSTVPILGTENGNLTFEEAIKWVGENTNAD